MISYLLCLLSAALFVFSFSACLDIDKILANRLRKMKSTRILSLEIRKKVPKGAILFFLAPGKSRRETCIAEPLVGKRTFNYGRIDASEVE